MPDRIKELSARIVLLTRERRIAIWTVESSTAASLELLLSQAERASDTLHSGFVVYLKDNKTVAVGVPKEPSFDRSRVDDPHAVPCAGRRAPPSRTR
jgi:nicotinamide mononucleotide (NMN) deamidase PncC